MNARLFLPMTAFLEWKGGAGWTVAWDIALPATANARLIMAKASNARVWQPSKKYQEWTDGVRSIAVWDIVLPVTVLVAILEEQAVVVQKQQM